MFSHACFEAVVLRLVSFFDHVNFSLNRLPGLSPSSRFPPPGSSVCFTHLMHVNLSILRNRHFIRLAPHHRTSPSEVGYPTEKQYWGTTYNFHVPEQPLLSGVTIFLLC